MTVYLENNMVPAKLRGTYSGKQFRAVICESVTIPLDAGLWDHGSRETYRAVRLSDGAAIPLSQDMAAPWSASRREQSFVLERGIVVIKHTLFCGKDLGLTFYMRAEDAAPLLPAPAPAMNATEKAVLSIIRSCKSSYRQDEARRQNITVKQWAEAILALQGMGFVAANGAITTSGRNAVPYAW